MQKHNWLSRLRRRWRRRRDRSARPAVEARLGLARLEEKRVLEKEQALLKTEILTLRSPARIEAIARGQLGMVDPKTDRIIRVK